MTSARAGVAAVATTLLVLVGAAPAVACNEPKLTLLRQDAKAGDEVPYEISDTDHGASYTIEVNHRVVASGTDDDDLAGIRGRSFTMPDLGGSTRTVWAKLTVYHVQGGVSHDTTGGSGDVNTKPIRFSVPEAPPPPTSPPPPATDETGPDPPVTTGSDETEGETRGPDRTLPVAGRGPLTGGVKAAGEAARRSEHGTVSPPGRRPPATPLDHDRSPDGGGSGPTAARSEPDEKAPERARAGRPAPERSMEEAARDDLAEGLPWIVIVALSLAAAAGAAGAFVLRRRRGGPDEDGVREPIWIPPAIDADAQARDLLIEAELQEMIAEARAREAAERADETPERARDGPTVGVT